jgi:hypothetical protein
MADIPDTIVLERDRDLAGRDRELWIRRGLFALLCAVPVLALLNALGQRPGHATAASTTAGLDVYAPSVVRGGDLAEARFRITARQKLDHARLVLAPGWLEGMTVNTIEPAPVDETSADGRLSLSLGPIDTGHTYVLFVQFQVNPTNVGRRSQDIALYDGDRKLLDLDRTITVLP